MEDSPTEKEPSEVLTPDSNNATYFNATEAEESPSQLKAPVNYKRLQLLNRGSWKSRYEENKEVTHRRDNLAILDAISSQLELNKRQKKKARRIFDDLELGELGRPVKLVAFGVCAVVVNDDVPDGSRYHPQMSNPDGVFRYVARELQFTESQLHSIIGVVNHRRME